MLASRLPKRHIGKHSDVTTVTLSLSPSQDRGYSPISELRLRAPESSCVALSLPRCRGYLCHSFAIDAPTPEASPREHYIGHYGRLRTSSSRDTYHTRGVRSPTSGLASGLSLSAWLCFEFASEEWRRELAFLGGITVLPGCSADGIDGWTQREFPSSMRSLHRGTFKSMSTGGCPTAG